LCFQRHQFNCDSLDIVMIVSVTRDDLRDEFAMANEAFALSPISARAALPSEEDYEAINQAFMETSRGRWFLGEYARRNRNTDTRMVLDAVARIEESLAAQKQPAPESGLNEALIAIRQAVEQARAAASAAIDSLALEENLAPVRKGARIIREISWRWREIGADSRICDLLDSQVKAIEAACEQTLSAGPLDALCAAFDLIKERIAEVGEDDPVPPQAAGQAVRLVYPAPSDETPAAAVETVRERSATGNSETAASAPATPEATDATAEAAEAYDEAVLDLIALEMAAPDPTEADDAYAEADDILVAAAPPADPVVVAGKPEPMVAPPQPAAIQPSHQASLEHSLGSTLIANGIVPRPPISGPDPLAPIRRMSQAEKIAFFS
jgi:hypothetical protein